MCVCVCVWGQVVNDGGDEAWSMECTTTSAITLNGLMVLVTRREKEREANLIEEEEEIRDEGKRHTQIHKST